MMIAEDQRNSLYIVILSLRCLEDNIKLFTAPVDKKKDRLTAS